MNMLMQRVVLILAMGLLGTLPLHAQPNRAKVSDELSSYFMKTQARGILEVPGTDALADLGEEWSKAFRQLHPDGKVIYLPKLTKDAVKALQEGSVPLIIAARELTRDEMTAFQTKWGFQPMRIPVCLDANIVFVHKSNPLNSITMEQLDAIYSKTRLGGAREPARVWGDVGVKGDLSKRPINAYAREDASATRLAFKQMALLNGEFRADILERTDGAALAESILTDQAGIAFGPMTTWYFANKVLPVVPYKGSDARMPTQDNINAGKYPMPRIFYAYLNRAPGKPLDAMVNEFLHFILSKEGQNVIADSALLPSPAEFLTIALKRLDR